VAQGQVRKKKKGAVHQRGSRPNRKKEIKQGGKKVKGANRLGGKRSRGATRVGRFRGGPTKK